MENISTGIIRKIDSLGRIVLPKELRYSLSINDGDSFEILVNNNDLILRKYNKIDFYIDKIKKTVKILMENYSFKIDIIVKNKSIYSNSEISKELYKLIIERKKYENNLIVNKFYSSNTLLIPIIYESNLICTIIIYDSKEDTKIISNLLSSIILVLINM